MPSAPLAKALPEVRNEGGGECGVWEGLPDWEVGSVAAMHSRDLSGMLNPGL